MRKLTACLNYQLQLRTTTFHKSFRNSLRNHRCIAITTSWNQRGVVWNCKSNIPDIAELSHSPVLSKKYLHGAVQNLMIISIQQKLML